MEVSQFSFDLIGKINYELRQKVGGILKHLLRYGMFVLLFITSSVFGAGTADWMEEVYGNKPNTRLVDVAIPGTHNSGTYEISFLSKLEPGQSFFFNLIKPIVAGWSKTQFQSVYHQLIHGIRFLDIRIAFNRNKHPYVVHGLVSMSFKKLLSEISRFVDHHPREIVLLTYQLEYNYKVNKVKNGEEADLMSRLDQMVQEHFREQLKPFSSSYTFADFWQSGQSVMVLSDYQDFWAQSGDPNRVRAYLDQAIVNKDPNHFSNLQLLLTPPGSMGVFLNPKYSVQLFPNENSLSLYSMPVREQGVSWMKSWRDSGYRPNIVMTDFFDKFPFVQTVLDFNYL